MNFSQLSTFKAVMTSASLSDAAQKLGRTQPAVSAAIKALEDQLGLPLFERRGRKLIPVPEAQYLLAEADSILSQVDRVRQTMHTMSDGQAGSVRLAAMPGPVSMVFPKFVAARMEVSADVSVSIQARNSKQIAELTRAQSIDFGFADAPEETDTENLYQAERITADCQVAIPAGHELTRKSVLHLEDLENVQLGTLHSNHLQTRALVAAFQERNLAARMSLESQTFLPILHFVAAGQCCAVLDPLSVYLARPPSAMVSGIEVRPMADPIHYHYAIYSPRYRPISVMAHALKDAWRVEVMDLLEAVGANPQLQVLA